MSRVLYLYGGWPGHSPQEIARWTRVVFQELRFEVEESNDIFTLDRDLTGYARPWPTPTKRSVPIMSSPRVGRRATPARLWVGSFLRMFTHQRIQSNAGAPVARATLAICTAERMTGHGETVRLRLQQNIV